MTCCVAWIVVLVFVPHAHADTGTEKNSTACAADAASMVQSRLALVTKDVQPKRARVTWWDQVPAQSSCIDRERQHVRTTDGMQLIGDLLDKLKLNVTLPEVKVLAFPHSWSNRLYMGAKSFFGMNYNDDVVTALILAEVYRVEDGQGDYSGKNDGTEIVFDGGDHVFLSNSHVLLVQNASGKFQETHAENIKLGDKVMTITGEVAVTKTSTYNMSIKVGLLTNPLGLLLSESGVLIPPMDEGRPENKGFVNIQDVVTISSSWAPAAQQLHKDHPCLFDFLKVPGEENGKAVMGQFLEDFFRKHPHQLIEDNLHPDKFLEYIKLHEVEFASDALTLCKSDQAV